jgi:hypothetical protein
MSDDNLKMDADALDGFTTQLTPSLVTASLEGYAKAYSLDLALSTSDDNSGTGLTTVDGKADGQPMFVVTSQQAHDFLDLSVVQAAVDSGLLVSGDKPGEIPTGIVDGNGRVEDNAQFRAWYNTTGQNLRVAPPGTPPDQALHLSDYVSRLTTAIAHHS